jgi:hypothetical protein
LNAVSRKEQAARPVGTISRDRPPLTQEREIAHIKPAFKEVKLNRGRPMASASQDSDDGFDRA